jgi:Family of unknown function (DUF6518)
VGFHLCVGDTQDSKFIQSVVNVAGPWALLAFLVGTRARSLPGAACVGVLTLSTSVRAYYFAHALGEHVTNTRGLVAGVWWFPTAAAAGAAFGYLGRASRGSDARYRFGAVSALGAVLVAESVVLLLNQDRFEPGAVAFLAIEMLLGFSVPMLLLSTIGERVVVVGAFGAVALASYVLNLTLVGALRDRFGT